MPNQNAPQAATTVTLAGTFGATNVLSFNGVPSKAIREALKAVNGEYAAKHNVWLTETSVESVQAILKDEAKAAKAEARKAKAAAPKAASKNARQVSGLSAEAFSALIADGKTPAEIIALFA